MSKAAPQWTPPPNWPTPEPGWQPPPGWQPDPGWGSAPEGWDFHPKPWSKLKADEKKALDPGRAKKETRNGGLVLVGLLVLVGGCVAATGGDDDAEPTARSTASSTPSAEGTDPPAESSAPAEPATPVAPADPSAVFDKDVRDRLGDLNRDGAERVSAVSLVDGNASVRIAFNDNLTEGFIKTGAAGDVLEVIESAKTLPGLMTLQVVGTFPLTSNLGETSEQEVTDLIYSADIVNRIQVDSIDRDNVFTAADVRSVIHPAFRQDE